MPSRGDLITLLSGIPVNGRDQSRAGIVAGHLVESVLKNRWHQLSEPKRRMLVRPSAKRLWASYMHKRKLSGQSPEEAAEETIDDELAHLTQMLNSN